MKRKTLSPITLLTLFTLLFITPSSYAQEKEIVAKSDISEVTVYLSGAQITRKAQVQLNSGQNTVVFRNLSPGIDGASIQAKGSGDFTILSVQHQLNYMEEKKKSPEIIVLEDSLELLKQKIDQLAALTSVYTEEQAMLLSNKSIGGQDKGVDVTALKDATEYFRTRLTDIKTKQLDIARKQKDLNETKTRIANQLKEITAGGAKNSGMIMVKVNAKERSTAEITISYLVSPAGWTPSYEIRAVEIPGNVKLGYKANIHQSTSEDWEKVKLTLSTGNPYLSGSKPDMQPWRIDFFNAYTVQQSGGYYNNMEQSRAPMAAPAYDRDSKLTIAKDKATTAAAYTEVSENQTNVEFEIKLPYTILSDGKNYMVDIQNHELNAKFHYHAVPKMDKDAFLVAKVSGWEEFNLMPGEASIFFENTYVGKSYINSRSTDDSLSVSFGRDKNVVVTRIRSRDYSSKNFIGSYKKDIYGWEINVRNKKKQEIQMTLEDQIPLSSNKDISIELNDRSGADYNEETGKLSWNFSLKPSEARKFMIVFSVKYPKDKAIRGL